MGLAMDWEFWAKILSPSPNPPPPPEPGLCHGRDRASHAGVQGENTKRPKEPRQQEQTKRPKEPRQQEQTKRPKEPLQQDKTLPVRL